MLDDRRHGVGENLEWRDPGYQRAVKGNVSTSSEQSNNQSCGLTSGLDLRA